MVELILQVLIVISGIITVETCYNTWLYRQPKTSTKIVLISVVSVITAIITLLLCLFLTNLKSLPYVGKFFSIIDFPFEKFFSFIPQWLLFLWFGVPIIIVWIVFAFRGGLVYRKIKADYIAFIQKQKSKDKKENSNNENTSDNQVKEKEEDNLIDLKPEPPKAENIPPKKYFLGKEVKLTTFNEKSITGLKKATVVARKNLVIGKTSSGYVAIYINGLGLKQLKRLFSKYSLDISELDSKPSIVFFTHNTVECRSLKQWIYKVRKDGKK